MVGDPSPTATRRRPWPLRSAGGLGRALVVAVFTFGILTAVALLGIGALLVLGFGLTTPGIVVGAAGAVIGLVYAASQGAPL